ncbi:hypothetical protein B0H11DRAFT_2103442 [Mycena galericulata]|nr:hypothetical protein B0H11DRAFT_2103442 [Mycena galericulata]
MFGSTFRRVLYKLRTLRCIFGLFIVTSAASTPYISARIYIESDGSYHFLWNRELSYWVLVAERTKGVERAREFVELNTDSEWDANKSGGR